MWHACSELLVLGCHISPSTWTTSEIQELSDITDEAGIHSADVQYHCSWVLSGNVGL
jgi:hypothetical protein